MILLSSATAHEPISGPHKRLVPINPRAGSGRSRFESEDHSARMVSVALGVRKSLSHASGARNTDRSVLPWRSPESRLPCGIALGALWAGARIVGHETNAL